MTGRQEDIDIFRLGGVATSLVYYGVNVCLLIQLFRTVKPTRLWVTATTLVLFLVVSTFQVLISCVTLIACAGHSGGTSTWFSIQWVARSWLVIRTTAGISTAIQHSFLLYQYYTIYSPRGKNTIWVLGLPALLLLASFGFGAYCMVLSNDMSLEFLPHYPLCFSVKLLLVSLIVAKLVLHRKRLQESFEDSSGELTRPYTFLIHIFIQSHALYGALSLIFLGLYLTAQPAWRTILPNIVQAGLMSHLLVCFRVMRNREEIQSPSSEKGASSIRFSTSSQTLANDPATNA